MHKMQAHPQGGEMNYSHVDASEELRLIGFEQCKAESVLDEMVALECEQHIITFLDRCLELWIKYNQITN